MPALSNPTALRTRSDIYCVDDDSDVVCWGNHYYGQSKVPADLSNVTAFAVGDHHTCAIANSQVRCWGGNEYGQSEVPDDLVAPSAITAGIDHTCVNDRGEIRCWGQNTVRLPLTGADAFNPALFSSYEYVMCVVDPGQPVQPLHWNETGAPLCDPIELNGAYLLAGAENAFCVGEVGATWVRCWNPSENTDTPSSLTEPQSLSLSPFHGCAVQNGAAVCWGSEGISKDRGQMTVPLGLPAVTQVDTGRFHSCALGVNQRLYCWGEMPVPKV